MLRRLHQFTVLCLLGAAPPVLALQTQSQQNQNTPPHSQPQQKQQDKSGSKQQPAQQPPPAPLFEGKATLKSSRQGKETATAGFNGIGPDGTLQNSVLTATPSPEDAQRVAAMSSTTVSSTELAEFMKQGNLNTSKH
jgi:hypothetical protein